MYTRLCNPIKSRSFFLFGARATGKTHLLRGIFEPEEALWIDLLREGEVLSFSRNKNELFDRIAGCTPRPTWVVIDEIQRVPYLLNHVHALIEEKNIKFAMTGSSARKLKRGGGNLLAGRALIESLYPLTFQELGSHFSLPDVLNWGSLPAISNESDLQLRQRMLTAYVDTYLREEIREEQIIRRLDPFASFLGAAAQSSGKIINAAKIGREAGTDSKTIARYFQILEETLVGFFLEPYHTSVRKRQRQQAKFYLFDVGVRRALEGTTRTSIVPQTYEWGRAFEELVILEAARLNSYLHTDFRFSYLKTQHQAEIDLILERHGDRPWAIEIKSSTEVDPTEITKLANLSAAIKGSRPIFLYGGSLAKEIGGVRILPWQEGLREIFGL